MLRVTHNLWNLIRVFDYLIIDSAASATHGLTLIDFEVAFVPSVHIDGLVFIPLVTVAIHWS